MSAILDSLKLTPRVLPAPMAGGPTTPELVRAAGRSGSFGTLAWGTASLDAAREQARAVTTPGMPGVGFGVNLFHPQAPLADAALAHARSMGADIEAADLSFGWAKKLHLALDAGARVVWSMFGTFSEAEIDHIHAAGAEAWTTVTAPAEAEAARGVDALCVQGPEAGGHRGVWDPAATPDERPLAELVAAVAAALGDNRPPLIAAGGLRNAADVAQALSLPGVEAVSCGSAFLLAEEAGTSERNRALLSQGQAPATVSTRAFSGRYARGLETAYTRAHPDTPAIYPYLNQVLKPRRAAGDPEVDYCLVGTRPELIRGGSVAQILEWLCQNGH